MNLWRIFAYPGLGGVGGHHQDGRWHSMKRSVIYAGEHPALAMVEVMAHMRLSLANIPVNLKLIRLSILDGATTSPRPALPAGWQANEPTSQAVGNAWLDGGTALLLPVPSALISDSTNYLVNPNHAEAATHLVEEHVEAFWFDKRFPR
jgi:RES domain-containing protein